MEMGPITAVQADSPAAAAKIEPGDVILQVDGRPVDDPMTVPGQLARRAGETVALSVARKASGATEVVRVKLREPIGYLPEYTLFDSPVEVSALGITYRVGNRVARVADGGPAAKAGLSAGDVIVKAKLVPPDKETLAKLDADQAELSIPFDEQINRNWPALCSALQTAAPGTTVELTFMRGEKEQTAAMQPVEATDCFSADRGWVFESMLFARQPKNLRDALVLGGRETLDNTTIVFRSLRALGTAKVSPKNLVGPKGIIELAISSADQGNARLLLFLTMLSANLAVINAMPIPLLDGGLMMFLLYEAIRRKPANQHVQVVLTYIGLALIIALMVWVCGLDFGLIPRR
jgi:regulator of sigma E protease